MIPACSNSSLRSFARTSPVSIPIRSSRSSVSPNSAPRGTAIRSSLMAHALRGPRVLRQQSSQRNGRQAAAGLRHPQQQLELLCRELQLLELPLHTDEVADDELLEDPLTRVGVDSHGLQQLRVEGGVSEADAVRLESRGVERFAQDRD